MLTVKMSTGVTPEVKLRNSLDTGTYHASEGSTLALKPKVDVTTTPKQASVALTKKNCCPPFFK